MVNIQVPDWLNSKLTEEDCKDIKDLIVEIEKHTSGEVVPMIVKQSSTIGHVPYLIILSLTLIDIVSGFWSYTLSLQVLPSPLIIATHFATLFVATRWLSGNSWLQRYLTPKSDQKFQVEQRAVTEFYEHKIHHTDKKTGILIFISVMERMAVVIGDEAINNKLNPQDWQRTLEKILNELKEKRLKAGIIQGLNTAKDLLSQHFPAQPGDINELSNDLIIKE